MQLICVSDAKPSCSLLSALFEICQKDFRQTPNKLLVGSHTKVVAFMMGKARRHLLFSCLIGQDLHFSSYVYLTDH